MIGKPTNPNGDVPIDSEDDDRDLRELFRRTAPDVTPLDVAALLARANLLSAASQPRRYRGLMAAAAVLLLIFGITGGWWAGRRAAADEAARIEASLASTRSQITRDLADALRTLQVSNQEAQRDELKRVAVLLRDDYRSRIAELEHWVGTLAMLVDKSDPASKWNANTQATAR
jgi:hypothetical protein